MGRDDETSLPTLTTPASMRSNDDMQDVDYFDDDDDLEGLDTPTSRGPSRLPMIIVGIAALALLAGGSYVAMQIVNRAAPQTENTTPPAPSMPLPVAQPEQPAASPAQLLSEAPVATEPTPEAVSEQPADALVTLPPDALPATSPAPGAPDAPVAADIPADQVSDPVVEEVPTKDVTLLAEDDAALDAVLPQPPSAAAAPKAAEPDLGPEDFYEAKDVVKALESMQSGDTSLVLEEPAPQPYIEITKPNAKSDAERNVMLAERALAVGRYQMAADLYNEVLARNNQDVRALIGRAIASQNLGNAPQAISDYEAALDLKPDNTEALINLLGLIQAEQPQAALSRLDTLSRKYPSNAGIVAQQGMILANLGNLAQAGAFLDRAITLEPSNPMHYYNRAVIADQGGDTSLAIDMYERSLEVDAIHSAGRKVPRDRIYDRLAQLRH